ncbi:anti-phage ZorAB system protein ZorA [Selenomonas sp.]|uniref:anti-phage ZorAB system protein ZorA n=1 Tax=Selenomonas sp. TaxID=2053611 RepID=UPI0025E91C5E|nr:anti-phage ZorAB system protein ZorA [Selenomonas sp.]MCI6283414.1 anti-phage defense ZorAB system protein ZorA [Selenomonas sp.]MDY4416606.1 anti-phage ZorAB system protein ZorA [Selenomonas sp.]
MSNMSSIVINLLFLVADILLAVVVWKFGIVPLQNIQQDVHAAAEKLRAIPREDYVRRFEDISKLFLENVSLRNVWLEYRKTLVRSIDADGEERLFSAIDASAFFCHRELTKSAHVSYWQNFGGVFTGVGIFGTFLGLTFGIWGIDLSSTDVTVLKEGIGALLGGICTAFITSVLGIACALVYGGYYHYENSRLDESIAALSNLIETMYPRQITEQWLSDGFQESREQTRTLKNLSQDMAESLGQILDTQLSNGFDEFCEKLDSQLRPTFERLYEAISALKEGGTTAIANEFDRQVGTQLQAFSRVLTEMQAAMQSNVQASQQASEDINRSMQQTMTEMQELMAKGTSEAVEQQKSSAEQMRHEMHALIEALQHGSQEAMDHYAAVSREAQEQWSESVVQTKRTTEDIVAQMQEMAGVQEERLQAMAGAQEKQLQAMTGVQEKQLQAMASAQEERWQAMADKQEKLLQASAAAAEARAGETTRLLSETIAQQNDAFAFASNAVKEEAVRVAEILTKLQEAGAAMHETITPIQEAAAGLREELATVHAESRELHDGIRSQLDRLAADNATAARQMQDLMQAMKSASEASDTAWKTYQENFEGVSGELERTTTLLTEQLLKYNEAMKLGLTSQLEAFDTSVSSATGSLSSIADELRETLDDMMKQQSKHEGRMR